VPSRRGASGYWATLTHYPANRLQYHLSDSSSALAFRFSRGSRGGRLRPARCRAPRCTGHPLPPRSLALPRAARSRPTHARCTHVAAASSSFLDTPPPVPPRPPEPLPSCPLLDHDRAPTEDDSASKALAMATLAFALFDRGPARSHGGVGRGAHSLALRVLYPKGLCASYAPRQRRGGAVSPDSTSGRWQPGIYPNSNPAGSSFR